MNPRWIAHAAFVNDFSQAMKTTFQFSHWFVGAASLLSATAQAGVLSGSYEQDPVTGWYTYHYVVDNRGGTGPISEVSLLIDSAPTVAAIPPLAHLNPAGWSLTMAGSGSIADPPYNEKGLLWVWGAGGMGPDGMPQLHPEAVIRVGQTLSGFSVTTVAPPAVGQANNYFLFSLNPDNPNDGSAHISEYGHIVAPDFAGNYPVPIIPEPSTVALVAMGLLGLIGRRDGIRRGPAVFISLPVPGPARSQRELSPPAWVWAE